MGLCYTEDGLFISNSVQMSMGLPEPKRAKACALLREYLDILVNLAMTQGASLGKAIEQALAIQNKLWFMAVLLAQQGPDPSMAALLALLSVSRIMSPIWYTPERILGTIRR